MESIVIIVMLIIIPVILFPAAYVWYLNIGGVIAYLRKRRIDKTKV